MRKFYTIIVLLISVNFCTAQKIDKKIWFDVDSFSIDSNALLITSLEIYSVKTNKKYERNVDYTYSTVTKKIYNKHIVLNDTLRIVYYRIPTNITASKSLYTPVFTGNNSWQIAAEKNAISNTNNEETVSTDGVLLRGISFGNAQDLALNSNLNLRLKGNLSNEISIEAAIADQDYPLQADGTTNQLQDFDKIYGLIKYKQSSILLGDYAFNSNPKMFYSKYAKRNRGLQIGYHDTGKKNTFIEGSFALARGRFMRNEIQGSENLQGPYRLTGARNELFVIVISGTESVFLDGKKMNRGLQADYIIDYNLGEITFTPKNIINAFSRIVIEFQYSDRFYTRTVASVTGGFTHKKFDFFATIYNEQDLSNQPILENLNFFDSSKNKSAKEILQLAGDNNLLATATGIKKLDIFSNNIPNYKKIINGIDTFYEYANQLVSGEQYYRINFSFVGNYLGTYIIAANNANGKTYKFVGKNKGNYLPIIIINAPNKLSLAEFGTVYKYHKNSYIKINNASSYNDKNILSSIDDYNNFGNATKVEIADARKLGRDSNSWQLKNKMSAEYITTQFNSIERIRDIEFNRQWERKLENPNTNNKSTMYAIYGLEITKNNELTFGVNMGRNKQSLGISNFLDILAELNRKKWYVKPMIKFANSNTVENNKFEGKKVSWGTKGKKINTNVTIENEKSIFINSTVLNTSYYFEQYMGNFLYNFSNYQLEFSGQIRRNAEPAVAGQKILNSNLNQQLFFRTLLNSNQRLNFSIAARNVFVLDTIGSSKKNENQFSSRIEYGFSKIKNIFSGNVFYQTISGREQQRQFSYIEVPAGLGNFAWIDFNGNGIQEMNEFQETPFKDQAKFIRILIPTANYLRAQNSELNGNITANKRFKNNQFNYILGFNSNGKSTNQLIIKKSLPILEHLESAQLISINGFLRNTLEWQKERLLIQINQQLRNQKFFFTNGFDFRKNKTYSIFSRWDINNTWQIRFAIDNKNSNYSSQILPINNYFYQLYSAEPTLVFQPRNVFRINLSTKYNFANDANKNKLAELKEAEIKYTHNLQKYGVLDIAMHYFNAAFLGKKNSPLAFDLLQGFATGNNMRITSDLRFTTQKNIQITVGYEARKLGDARWIHVGRAEARYLF